MLTYLDYPDDTLEYTRDRANYWFDCAEENFREAFKADTVRVARYADDPEPYKRTIGAILECVEDSYLYAAFTAICKLQKIDPEDAHESYRHWLNGAE